MPVIDRQVIGHKLSLYTQDSVKKMAEAMRKVGGPNPLVTIVPITYSSGEYGPVQLPLFRVQAPNELVMRPAKVGDSYAMVPVVRASTIQIQSPVHFFRPGRSAGIEVDEQFGERRRVGT